MFTYSGLALMLLESAIVAGRPLPAGSVGTEDDFGDDLNPLLEKGLLMPFNPWQGLPPIPSSAPRRSFAYADMSA
ncbi:MAG: hypothetical protein ACO1SV_08515 [Fimbriimonas sp.]